MLDLSFEIKELRNETYLFNANGLQIFFLFFYLQEKI
jgi:hypothetical protein